MSGELVLSRGEFSEALVIAGAGAVLSALAGRFGSEAVLSYLETTSLSEKSLGNEWLLEESLPLRKPGSGGVDRWSERPGEKTPFLTDEAGFVIVQRPPGNGEASSFADPSFARVYQECLRQPINSVRPGVEIIVGDSYLQAMSPALLQGKYEWMDLYGASGIGPEEYLAAVERRFNFKNGVNGRLYAYLEGKPNCLVAVSLHLTPHTDLEQVNIGSGSTGFEDVAQRLETNLGRLTSRRGFLRVAARAAGIDNLRREQIVRSFLNQFVGSQLTNNDRDFDPDLADKRVVRLLRIFDEMIGTVLQSVGNSHSVRFNLIANPSFYDSPERNLGYGWDKLLENYASQSDQVFSLPVREGVRVFLRLTGTSYSRLFNYEDCHYSADGRALFGEVLAWTKAGRVINQETLSLFVSEMEERMSRHLAMVEGLGRVGLSS